MRRSIVLATASACLFSIILEAQELAAEPNVAQEPKVEVLDVPLYGQKWDVWCWATTAQMVIDYLYHEEYQDFLARRVHAGGEGDFDPAAALQTIKTTDLPRTVRQCEVVNQRYNSSVNEMVTSTVDKSLACFDKPARQDQESCLKMTLASARLPKSVDCCADNVLELKKEDRKICVEPGAPNPSVLGAFGVDATPNLCPGKKYGCPLTFRELMTEIDEGRPVVFSWLFEDTVRHLMVAVGYVSISSENQWVVVHDPWPPPNGKRHMIPYSYYKTGPYIDWWTWKDIRLTVLGKEKWRRGSWDIFEQEESSP